MFPEVGSTGKLALGNGLPANNTDESLAYRGVEHSLVKWEEACWMHGVCVSVKRTDGVLLLSGTIPTTKLKKTFESRARMKPI